MYVTILSDIGASQKRISTKFYNFCGRHKFLSNLWQRLLRQFFFQIHNSSQELYSDLIYMTLNEKIVCSQRVNIMPPNQKYKDPEDLINLSGNSDVYKGPEIGTKPTSQQLMHMQYLQLVEIHQQQYHTSLPHGRNGQEHYPERQPLVLTNTHHQVQVSLML